MARFRLKEPHYLNVPGTEWEQNETDLSSKKSARKRFPVPRYLNTNDVGDFNYPGVGIIVTNKEDPKYPQDILFSGYPTPDMEALDEEANEMLSRLRPYWEKHHPIESLSGSYGEAIQSGFEAQINAMGGLRPTVADAEIEELKRSNAALQAQVTELLALLKPKAESARRA